MKQHTRVTLAAGSLAVIAASMWFGLSWYNQQTAALNLSDKNKGEAPTYLPREAKTDTEYVLVKSSNIGLIKALEAQEALAEDTAQSDQLSKLQIKRFKVPNSSTAEEVARRMEARLKSENTDDFAEADILHAPQMNPDDPWYQNQWGLVKISGSAAWDISQGSESVTIAVLDSGVAPDHDDLQNKLVGGWNTFNNNSDTSDVYGHGTGVAGVASVTTNNALGISSLCWNCKIAPYRVTDSSGYAYTSSIISALGMAADAGIKVANLSFEVSQISSIRTAAQSFQSRGGVITAAAGNDGQVHSEQDNPYIITVNATDGSNLIYSWSDRGNDIDVNAPGSTIALTRFGDSYGTAGGTSYSAPYVASLAGLIYSVNPSLTGVQVQDIIKQSADDLGSAGWDAIYGWGRINAYRAVQMAGGTGSGGDTSAPSAPSNLTGKASGSTSIVLNWGASTDNVGVTAYNIYRNGALLRSVDGTTLTHTDSGLTPGATYSYYVKASDAAGNLSAASNTVSVTLSAGFAWVTLPYVSSKTATSAVITFTTNQASTAVVEFWPRNGAHQTASSASATTHNVTLTGLTPGGKYSYFVRVTSADGTVLTSATSSFSTPRR